MLITLVAVLCHSVSGIPEPVCVEEIVTDNDMSGITWMSCQVSAQEGISKWMSENPKYAASIEAPHAEGSWHLSKWKCVPGQYSIAGKA